MLRRHCGGELRSPCGLPPPPTTATASLSNAKTIYTEDVTEPKFLGQSELLAAPLEPAAPLCGFRYDVRLAFRNMRTRPVFTLLAIVMLALGIGGNAAIFSIFNGMFLRPLP